MTNTEWMPLLTYCLVMSGTPGPNNVMLATLGANQGYRSSLPFILGINMGLFVQTVLCGLGLGSLLLAHPRLHAVLRLVGVAYLLWLAWQMARTRTGAQARAGQQPGFWQATAFQAVNPKSWIKALTLGAVFMPAGMPPLAGALLIGLVGWAIGFPCNSVWVMFGAAIRGLLADPRRQRAFNALMGLTLAVLAVSMLRT
ncbi:MAG TPA: LysE family translocator [Ideonella sp.]|uniref:LysE family translocator n=1 Tax=Ideonella sp. TaxID=1929293 RepID=UPI002CB95F89|nr:LysE family translocator [Ideonella sp.]HSI50584.1 LysE family translocator [Ideonella sp.]